jgi:hypothetical protein
MKEDWRRRRGGLQKITSVTATAASTIVIVIIYKITARVIRMIEILHDRSRTTDGTLNEFRR